MYKIRKSEESEKEEKRYSLYSQLLCNIKPLIHCSHNKSGAYSKPPIASHIALKHYEFIEFNSLIKCSIVVMDKDAHEGTTAKEYFGDLIHFQEWLNGKIDITPSYLCETTKGYQFGFILKAPFLLVQNSYKNKPKHSPQRYLEHIKSKYVKYLELDPTATNKNYGIYRNPYKHKYIASSEKSYSLNDLNNALLDFEEDLEQKGKFNYTKRAKYLSASKIYNDRNNTIFSICAFEFAYQKPTLTTIFNFANKINITKCIEPLKATEIKSIAKSIYKYTVADKLKNGRKKAQINRDNHKKQTEKKILKYILKCKKDNTKINLSKMAQTVGVSRASLYKTYKDFIDEKCHLL